jgi:hypothetical protein
VLSNDRLVGVFGSVPAGDRSALVKIAVAAVRAGFHLVVCEDGSDKPVCTLTARDQKKDPDHECYHVLSDDKTTRTVLNRLTKAKGDGSPASTYNLAVELEPSKLAVAVDWTHPEISATMERPDGSTQTWFEVEDPGDVPEEFITKGALLVPPSLIGEDPIRLVGQLNYWVEHLPIEGKFTTRQETELTADLGEAVQQSIWNDNVASDDHSTMDDARYEELKQENAELAARLDKMAQSMKDASDAMGEMGKQIKYLKDTVLLALQTIQALKKTN